MAWWHSSNDNAADGIEDFAYPPEGGRVKQVLLGIVMALGIAAYAVQAWRTGKAIWFGKGGDAIVTGEAARAMAVCYFAIAAFCHFRWFWGMVPVYRVCVAGTVLAMITGLGGCAAAFHYVMR